MRITTQIKKPFLDQIVAKEKKIEYREVKPYWTKRLKAVTCPFELRLINGMSPWADEATVIVTKVDCRDGQYRLHIGKILNYFSI